VKRQFIHAAIASISMVLIAVSMRSIIRGLVAKIKAEKYWLFKI